MEKREKSSRLLIFIVFIPFLIWIILQFLGPFALPSNTVTDLSGSVGISENNKLINELPAPWNSIYRVGDTLCHQKAERSFFLNDNQMPFCARCTAIWLGLTTGIGFMVLFKIELDEKFVFIIILGLVPIGIDGVGQLFGFWESNNFIRLVTGLLIGIVCGLSIGVIIDELRDMFLSRKTKSN